jgi:nitrogen fixation protein FixH
MSNIFEKLHFGTGIAIFYTIFAGTMIFFVFKSTQYDHSLVREDYYKGDLEYQEHFDKLTNTNALHGAVTIQHQAAERELLLRFPTELQEAKGKVTFFRPSNSQQDQQVALATDEELRQVISTKALKSGRWTVQIDWSSGGKSYYKEMDVVL